MSKTAVINLKTDPKLKKEAMELADTLGVSLSQVLNQSLKQFTAAREFIVTEDYTPTPYLEKLIQQAERELAAGETIGPLSGDELIEHLKGL